jgi:hypothetical protein
MVALVSGLVRNRLAYDLPTLLLLLCVLRLFTVPLVLPSSAGVDPTAHIIISCASALRTTCHGVVIGHALHPVTLAILLHMLLFYLYLCASALSVRVYSSGWPCTP